MIYLFLVLVLIRLSYWVFLFTRLALYKPTYNIQDDSFSVSILVCVKNNLNGIKMLLPKLLKQNFEKFEIVLVDDFSTDKLSDYIQSIEDKRIQYLNCSKDIAGKKQAITDGVMVAKYDWIMTIDADCMPASLDWIKWMTASIKDRTEIVLGYSPIKEANSFTAYMAKYETFYIGVQYLSYALFRRPYMGVGRNLMFNKKSFIQNNPYASNMHIASGDDDFLVNSLANDTNVEICIHPNAFTYTTAPSELSQYFNQKQRHISTALNYPLPTKLALGIFAIVHLMIYLLYFINFYFGWFPASDGAGIILIMWSSIFVVQLPISNKLKEAATLLAFPVMDFLIALFYLFLSPKSFIRNLSKWN